MCCLRPHGLLPHLPPPPSAAGPSIDSSHSPRSATHSPTVVQRTTSAVSSITDPNHRSIPSSIEVPRSSSRWSLIPPFLRLTLLLPLETMLKGRRLLRSGGSTPSAFFNLHHCNCLERNSGLIRILFLGYASSLILFNFFKFDWGI